MSAAPGGEAAWGCSSVGRALESHSRGQGFDSPQLHTRYMENTLEVRQPVGSGLVLSSRPSFFASSPNTVARKRSSFASKARMRWGLVGAADPRAGWV